ncbi:hypothetical protein SAMN05421821_105219 [Mucilaginibacter lappiensis]|uniref:Lipopolysaccharide export LptBFGC system permease protein LptF n=1 Tax=Mucilaginibacter lappiensis TaxID=354630 RepID=A0ABR6PNE7_9SPHI|nr:hypothetical protein [Mucilaginibacter lappiensis]MBB6109801.1 lipopolysaccharide export LptBFGC system permease protein LptF [Mucilaginibacter lappiensis]SIR16004.1 hypothetical protein SAMN05421821_105219 [Mucilaginibacter lappiensis]
MCETGFDFAPWIAIVISIIALLVALYVGYYTIRLQVISAIENKLTIKAKECNKYIIDDDQKFPLQTHYASAIISSILYATHILDLQFKTYNVFLWRSKKQGFKDIFYLELHTSISDYVHRNQLELIPDDPTLRPIINRQLQDAHDFLEESDSKFRFK